MKSVIIFLLWCLSTDRVGGFSLTIMHTNDVHAKFEEFNKNLAVCSEEESDQGQCFGGMARHVTIVRDIRDSADNVLYLNAGDFFQGTLWYTYYKGLATAYFANKLGIDAASFGNHELDDGVDVLIDYLSNVTFPIISCNLDSSREPELEELYQPSILLTLGRERIGVVGYITTETTQLVPTENVKTLVFEDEITSIRREVNGFLSAGVNKIIVVGHGGFLLDQKIAKEVQGVDVIVGGHSNTFLYTGEPPSTDVPTGDYPFIVEQDNGAKVLIVQAYAYGKYMGHLQLTFNDEGVVTSYTGNPILLDNSVEQDPDTLAEIIEWREPLDAWTTNTIGKTHVLLDGSRENCRARECSFGNLLTDAILYSHIVTFEPNEAWTNIAIVVWNAGSIRASIPQGDITMGHIFSALPFRNEIIAFYLPGVFMKQMLEHSVLNIDPADLSGGYLQMSGLKVVYDLNKPSGQRVVSVQALCANCAVPKYEDLDVNKMYGILTSAFIFGGGDGYTMIKENAQEVLPIGLVAADVVVDYVIKQSPVITGLENRITFIEDKVPPLPSRANSLQKSMTKHTYVTFLLTYLLLESLLC